MNSSQIGQKSLVEIDLDYLWHPFSPLVGGPERIAIESGQGARLITVDGREIIDAVSSWWVNIHGHCNPIIAQAISEQANRLEQVIFAGFTHEPAVRLAKNLLKILPEKTSKIFFSDDGSTAVEVALKMSIQYWYNLGRPRKKIVALDGAYHGDTFGSMSIAERGPFNRPFHPFLFDVDFIPFPSEDQIQQTIDAMKVVVKSGEVAAFIFEPLVQGSSGMRMYRPQVLDALIKIARDNQVLCIADEVMTGFGRTGRIFASDYLENKPDIFCLSKGITGGFLPLGVTSCSQEVENAFRSDNIEATFFHGHSYTANPISCSAANASFDILMSAETLQRIQRISDRHSEFLKETGLHAKIRDIRTRGTIMAVELETGTQSSYFDSQRSKTYDFFLDRGILMRPLGNTIYLLPPYVITPEELNKVYAAIHEFLNEY